MTKDEMQAALAVQKLAAMKALPVSATEREERLNRLIALLTDNGRPLVEALSDDFGHRSAEQSWMTDIVMPIKAARHARGNLRKWMKPERRPLEFPLGLLGARARIEYQPKGVVGVVVPWNFPIQLAFGALAGVFAAGNRAMVKTSEFTPATSQLLASLAPEYFSTDELLFVSGGPEAGQDFTSLPFDHLIFTGGTGIGRHIMRAVAENLTPVTLELGGKSPVIVGRSADMKEAALRIAMGKTLNAGQICVAPDYVLVPRERADEMAGHLSRSVQAMYPTLLDNPDYTSIIHARHRDRLRAYLDDASTKGGEVVEINPAGEDFASGNTSKLPVYLVRNPRADMKVMQEEIFGPILPLLEYDRIDEAIGHVNAHDRPLALYYFGSDAAEQRRILDTTISGGVTVNDVIFHVTCEDLPFGGIGPSGIGAYHGIEGFRTFSHAKSIYSQPRINVARLAGLLPPYGKVTRMAISREFKFR